MNVNILREIDYEAKCYPDVKMKLRNLSTSEFRKSVKYHAEEKFKNGRVKKPAQLEYDLDMMMDYMVFNISGLTLTDENDEVMNIKSGKDICDNPGLTELYLELTPVLLKMEARVDSKN